MSAQAQQWIAALHLTSTTVEHTIDAIRTMDVEDEQSQAVMELIHEGILAPGFAQGTSEEAALTAFKAGVLFGVKMTQVAIEEGAHD